MAFTDSDCEPDRDWIRSGVRALIENCNAAYVGGYIEVRLVNESRPNTAELYDYLTGFPQRQNIELRGLSATANLFAWRSTFDSVGYFNGALLAGGDVEWCRRALKKRAWPAFESRAIVRHPARTTEHELFLMKRRGMGGARDRDRSLFGCLVTILKQMAGLILDILSLFREKGRDLNVQQKLEVFAFSWRVRTYSIGERIKFQNPRVATPRA